MRFRSVRFLAALGLMLGTIVVTGTSAAQSPWHVSRNGETTAAVLTMWYPGARDPDIRTVLLIGFDRTNNCKAEVGIAILKGDAYGKTIGRVSPPKTEPVTLMVDGRQVPTPAPYMVKYENGWEATFIDQGGVVQALTTGRSATARMFTGAPGIVFPLAGAGNAVAEAQAQCTAGR